MNLDQIPDAEQFQKLHSYEGLVRAHVGMHVLPAQAACAHHRCRLKSAGIKLETRPGFSFL